jgi:uncharacterized protein
MRREDPYNQAMERERLLDDLTALLAASPAEVVAAYVFDSVARGEARGESDVDVAVLLSGPAPGRLDGLPYSLERRLELALRRAVQVVVLNCAPLELVARVLRDGKVLLERDRSQRIRFEVRARNLYFDLQPFLRRYRGLAGQAA